MDIFSFILLCYIVCVKEESFDISLLETYVLQVKQYSSAVRQLAENIVYHSKTQFGVIAIRVHKANSVYMENQYSVRGEEQQRNFLEIVVSDFCGDNQSGNIAVMLMRNSLICGIMWNS